MTQTAMEWFEKNRKKIGYTIGAVNVLSGLADLSAGNIMLGTIWIVIGTAILFDTKTFK